MFTMRLCELYFFSRGISYVYDNYNHKNNLEGKFYNYLFIYFLTVFKGEGNTLRTNKILYLVAGGIMSITFIKAFFFPTRNWAFHLADEAKKANTTEMAIAEGVGKSLHK